jgi:hypothetical protein
MSCELITKLVEGLARISDEFQPDAPEREAPVHAGEVLVSQRRSQQ